jgi:hypothetical protein
MASEEEEEEEEEEEGRREGGKEGRRSPAGARLSAGGVGKFLASETNDTGSKPVTEPIEQS